VVKQIDNRLDILWRHAVHLRKLPISIKPCFYPQVFSSIVFHKLVAIVKTLINLSARWAVKSFYLSVHLIFTSFLKINDMTRFLSLYLTNCNIYNFLICFMFVGCCAINQSFILTVCFSRVDEDLLKQKTYRI